MRIKEIEARLAAIKQEIETRGADMTAAEIDALEQETSQLTEERAGLIAAAEKRNGILDNIAKGAGIISRSFQQMGTDDNSDPEDPFGTPEYRSAWLKNIRRLPLNDAEKRAFSNAAGAGAEVIPTQTANEIISKVKKLAPMLNEVTLLHVKGAVKFAIEGANNDAAIHNDNAAITPAADTLTTVSLSGYEIVKLVQISDTVMTMSITAFESWIVDMLAEAIARKVEDLLINGTGSSQPKGIDKANTWGDTNSVTVTKTGSLTAANVQTLIGLLPSGYDRNGKFVMNKKTLFTDFMPLQDNSKNNIVTVQNNAYFVYGYPVLTSDYVADHEAFLGDFKKVCANLAENIGVKSAYDIDTNSYKYSGIAIFDCAPAIGEAIVKLVKATA
jgi:HK97 family phage major capsid protein